MTEYLTYDYPQNTRYREKWKILSLFIAFIGIPVTFVYQSIFPIGIFLILAILSYLGLWYGQDYSVPKKVGIGDHSIDLFYSNDRKTSITWSQLNSYGLSSSPETTVAPAIIFYSNRKFNYVSFEAAKEIAKRYELYMNKPLREVWLAKDLKNRFKNL